MKNYLLLACIFCLQLTFNKVIGQQDTRIVTWVSTHPSVYIFSEKNYEQLSSDYKSRLKGQVVLFKETLSFEDLMAYDGQEKTNEVSQQTTTRNEDAQMIKNWLAFHSDIKIVKQSEFQAMTVEQQNRYLSFEALILIGEHLTVQDITNYSH
jgi:hypothetical protein